MAQPGQTIHNPRTGERIIFRHTQRETGGAYVEFDHFLPPGPSAFAEHVQLNVRARRAQVGCCDRPAIENGPLVEDNLLEDHLAGRHNGYRDARTCLLQPTNGATERTSVCADIVHE